MDPQIRSRVPFCSSTWQPGYKKENCKGIDYFNRGEIKTKSLSWANRGTTKCTLSANDWEREAISNDKEITSWERCRGFARNCLQSHEGFILDRM